MELRERTALAESLLADDALPARVTDAFLSRHPEWEVRFGAAARRRCTEDARFHRSFLAGAVQAGRPEIFADYIAWCAGMLGARDIDPAHLAEYLDLLEEQLPTGGRQGLVAEAFALARALLAQERPAPDEVPHAARPEQLAYLSAALAGRRLEAWEAIQLARRRGVELGGVYRDVLVWTQRRLGDLWAAGKITVAQEHMASAVTQSVLGRLFAEIPGGRAAGRAVLAGVEDELHVLPAHLAADLLELDGWNVAFVGTHVPQASVVSAIEAERPDVVGLSTTMAFNLPKTVALVLTVRERFPSLPIVLGGRALVGASALAKELGVQIDPTGDGAAFRSLARA
jgi:methanogenic corrinoid protein MtbC1